MTEKENKIDILNENKDKSRRNSVSIKKNSFYNIIKTFSSIIFPLITFPYISRILKPENIGKVNFGNSIVSYFTIIATLGITAYAVRECSKVKDNKDELRKISSQIFSINLVTTLFSYFLLFICLFTIPALSSYKILILIQSASILFCVLGADWLNTAMEDFKYITIRTFLFQLISLVMMLLFVRSSEHYLIYAIIGVISSSGANIMNIFYRRNYCKVSLTFHMDWKKHFPPIMMLFTMIVAQSILGHLDTTMIGFLKGDYEVGLYSSCTKIINIISQVVSSITWVVMPQLSYTFEHKNYDEVGKIIHNALLFTVTLGLPCVIGTLFLAPEMLLLIGGKEFVPASNCLRIIAISMAIGFINNIYGNMILLPSGREKWFTIACVVGSVLNAITNAIFIPRFGIEGAAMTTVISTLVITIITIIAVKQKLNIGNIKDIIWGPVIGCILIAGICITGKQFISFEIIRLFVVIFVGIIVYFIVLFVTKNSLLLGILQPIFRRMHK